MRVTKVRGSGQRSAAAPAAERPCRMRDYGIRSAGFSRGRAADEWVRAIDAARRVRAAGDPRTGDRARCRICAGRVAVRGSRAGWGARRGDGDEGSRRWARDRHPFRRPGDARRHSRLPERGRNAGGSPDPLPYRSPPPRHCRGESGLRPQHGETAVLQRRPVREPHHHHRQLEQRELHPPDLLGGFVRERKDARRRFPAGCRAARRAIGLENSRRPGDRRRPRALLHRRPTGHRFRTAAQAGRCSENRPSGRRSRSRRLRP